MATLRQWVVRAARWGQAHLLGRRYDKIELEITLECNVRCQDCSRHSPMISRKELDFGDTTMTLAQVDHFIAEIKARPPFLRQISLMGGEPTIHPDFDAIVERLHGELAGSRLETLHIATNGVNKRARKYQDWPHVTIHESPPKLKDHRCQLVAPRDAGQETQRCLIPWTCGIALNRFGYSPCGAGAAIARLFGFTRHLQHRLPEHLGVFDGYVEELCSLCQASAITPCMVERDDPAPSVSFQRALDACRANPPRYPPYPGV